jgi:translation initiation factor 3 subunit L
MDFDFVMLLEDLPNRNKSILADIISQYNTKGKSIKEVGSEFFGQFKNDVRSGLIDNIGFMTDFVFHRISDEIYKDKPWPRAETLEESRDASETVLTLYRELYNRHIFSKVPALANDVQFRIDAFNNYQELFQRMITDKGALEKCELPCKWIWEIVDEAIYQFHNFSVYISKLKKTDSGYEELIQRRDIPTLTRLEKMLNDLVSRSEIINTSNKSITLPDKLSTKEFVGIFAYLGLIKLYLTFGQEDKAFQLLGEVSKDFIMKGLKRSWGALITFFYSAGLSYILKCEFIKGTKILERGCSFFSRYKHFLMKSCQYEKYNRLVERATLLLSIFLSFNKIEVEDSVMRVINDKYQDKYSKLLKYDQLIFEDTFVSGCLKMIKPLNNADDFEKYVELGQIDLVQNRLQKLVLQLDKYRILNGVESILLIYQSLNVDKLAKILDLQIQDIEQYLKEYEAIRAATLSKTSFEQTFLVSFMKNLKSYEFQLKDKTVQVKKIDFKSDSDFKILEFISELDAKNNELRKH